MLCRAGLYCQCPSEAMPVAYGVKLWGQRWCYVLKCICLILPTNMVFSFSQIKKLDLKQLSLSIKDTKPALSRPQE